MAAPRHPAYATLGWQTWSFVVVVLVIVLVAAGYLLFG